MMKEDFLLELGLEEMPAHVVTPSMEQLKERMTKFLEEHRFSFDSIEAFSTPRRLAVRVNGMETKQQDIEEEAKGPALRIAKDENGEWTKAAQGFARGQGMTTEDLYTKEFNGEEYVFVRKFIAGKSAVEVLPNLVSEVIEKMTFPTMMRWGNETLKFIRPIHWLVALLGEMIVPMEILSIGSGNISRGHRFLGQNVMIQHPKQYEKALMSQYVLVNSDYRKTMIMEQMVEFATKNQWKIDFDESLLEEVNNLVEWPTAFIGTFDEKYLEVPSEVLITSMKEHQRYFAVMDYDGKLLPYFIAVRNGNAEKIEQVILGNEKVLTARLEDAAFFYEEDQKHTIEDYMAKIAKVTFHEKIGTMTNKMERTKAIVQILAAKWNFTAEELEAALRASDIYKFDLVTGMVGEFSELQGIMGEKYALLQGESEWVAAAIREHYLPTTAEGSLPVTKVGALLAVADKLDSILSFFTVGLIPTGSNDPYALRRQTYGIIRILQDQKWNLPLEWLEEMTRQVESADGFHYDVAMEKIREFFVGRMSQYLSLQGVRSDIMDAAFASTTVDFYYQIQAAEVLENHRQDADMKVATESFTRIANLAQKAEKEVVVDAKLFTDASENELYEAYQALSLEGTIEENYLALKSLQPAIANYFENNMIMVEDEAVRNNRLSLLKQINQSVQKIADMSKLVIK